MVDGTGLMRLSLPSLVMINLDWTSVTEAISLDFLRENGVCVCAVCVHAYKLWREVCILSGSPFPSCLAIVYTFHFPHL